MSEEKKKPGGSALATFIGAVAGGVCVYFAGPLVAQALPTFAALDINLPVATQIALADPARAVTGAVGLIFVLTVSIHRLATGKIARIPWPLALVTVLPCLWYGFFVMRPYMKAFESLAH